MTLKPRYPAAFIARKALRAPAVTRLEDALLAALVAVGTYGMRQFGRLHAFLQHVDRSGMETFNFLQFVPLLLCFPVFECSQLCFKVAYLAQQRRIRSGRRDHEHRRVVLFGVQARHARHLSAVRRTAPPPLRR